MSHSLLQSDVWEENGSDKKEKANYDIKNSFPLIKFAISITIQDILIIRAAYRWHNWSLADKI